MNKKFLTIIIGMCFILMFILYITAEANLTTSEDSLVSEEGLPQEVNVNEHEIDNSENLYEPGTLSEEQCSLDSDQNSTLKEGGDSLINEKNYSAISNESQNIINETENNEENLEGSENAENIQINNLSYEENFSFNNSETISDKKIAEYVDLNEIISDSNKTVSEDTEISEQNRKEEVIYLYDSLGKRVVEIENCDEENILNLGIEVQEIERGEFEKEVIISSEEHFNSPFIFYSSLATESKKEDIKIYWKNEGNLEITEEDEFEVKYYDRNDNGLVDEISWIVPHLSEQVFEIVIDVNHSPESQGQILMNVSGPPLPPLNTKNPVFFEIELDYNGTVNCTLSINSENIYPSFNTNLEYELNLPDGDYTWAIICEDVENSSIYNSTGGYFEINEKFYSSLQEGKLYFLDLVENKIKNPETIIINSTGPSNFIVKIIKNEQEVIYTKNSSNSTTIVMNENLLNSSGIYRFIVEFDKPSSKTTFLKNFSVASADISFNTTDIHEGESVKITTEISSPVETILSSYVNYGSGEGVDVSYINMAGTNTTNFIHKYDSAGSYAVGLTGYIGNFMFNIQKNGITVTEAESEEDDSGPSITLLEPEDEEIIYGSAVNFSYKANDEAKIQNCTFKLYENCASMNYCSTSDSNLVFPKNAQQRSIANDYSVENNEEIEVKLEKFEEGIYEWLIECYDNSSNYDWEVGFFEIVLNGTSKSGGNYDQKEEVEELKDKADDFITGEFGLEEKEVLEDLNILNDVKYYKKRLLDIEDFFLENYKYVSSEELKEKKTEEYLEELENIRNRIPESITVEKSYEYVKNSIDSDLERIIEDYFGSTNTKIGKASVQKLARINKELQNEISVSAYVKNVEIVYKNETRKITLVKKEIKLNDDSYTKILEIVPKEIAENSDEITFITEKVVINKDPLFEIDYEDLDEKEIIYYIDTQVNVKDIEKTETILFEENLNKVGSNGVTGFFVIDFISLDLTLYFLFGFILLIILLVAAPFLVKKFRILGWRREPNVVKTMNLIEDIKRLLKEKEIEQAREKYYKIKEIYPILPKKTRPYFYERIKEVLIRIDRKDILGLVKEYQEAKRKWNKEDYMRLYEEIKKIYERLPEKDRKKVYGIINGY